jgi:hypothetical protein
VLWDRVRCPHPVLSLLRRRESTVVESQWRDINPDGRRRVVVAGELPHPIHDVTHGEWP